MSDLDDAAFLTWLVKECGYRNPKPIGNGRYACIAPFMFTQAIIVGRMGAYGAYDDRWCYLSYRMAKEALDAWDGKGEPKGWHRHPGTGRRVDPVTLGNF